MGNMASRPFSFVNGMFTSIGEFKNCLLFLGQHWRRSFRWLLIHNQFNDVFWAKISFFQPIEMRDEPKPTLKKIRVVLESRDSQWYGKKHCKSLAPWFSVNGIVTETY